MVFVADLKTVTSSTGGGTHTIPGATMTTNSIFLSPCIYNLEVLTFYHIKPFIKLLTRSPIILALFLNFTWLPLIELGSERDWVEAGSDVIQSTQTQ